MELPRQSLGEFSLSAVFTPDFLMARLCLTQDLSNGSIMREKRQIDGLVFLLTKAVSVLGNFGGFSKGWHLIKLTSAGIDLQPHRTAALLEPAIVLEVDFRSASFESIYCMRPFDRIHDVLQVEALQNSIVPSNRYPSWPPSPKALVFGV